MPFFEIYLVIGVIVIALIDEEIMEALVDEIDDDHAEKGIDIDDHPLALWIPFGVCLMFMARLWPLVILFRR